MDEIGGDGTIPRRRLERIARRAVLEDLGDGDLTCRVLDLPERDGRALVLFEEDAVFCGLAVAAAVLAEVDPRASLVASGGWLSEGTAFRSPINCGSSMDPVVRLWHKDAPADPRRHKFAVRSEVAAKAVAEGFVLEGQVFCGLR